MCAKVVKVRENGDRVKWLVLDTKFDLPSKYEIVEPIGSGAYGVVVAAREKTEEGSKLVAIKKIVKAFEHRLFTLRTYRELKI